MRVPLTVGDFLQRADNVYGDRIGVVDEPSPPGGSWGSLTWRQIHQKARAQAAGLDRLGVARGERVAIVSQNSARLLTSFFGVSGYGRVLVPINFRLSPAEIAYIVEHSGPSVLLVDPELDEALAAVDAKHRFVLGSSTDGELYREGVEPEPWDARRGRHRHHQLHERHDRPAQGRAAHPPQHLDQRGHLRLARRRERPRRLPPHAADVPRQRLGHAVRDHRHGRAAGRAAQGRRRRDPAPGRASTASPCCAARRRS